MRATRPAISSTSSTLRDAVVGVEARSRTGRVSVRLDADDRQLRGNEAVEDPGLEPRRRVRLSGTEAVGCWRDRRSRRRCRRAGRSLVEQRAAQPLQSGPPMTSARPRCLATVLSVSPRGPACRARAAACRAARRRAPQRSGGSRTTSKLCTSPPVGLSGPTTACDVALDARRQAPEGDDRDRAAAQQARRPAPGRPLLEARAGRLSWPSDRRSAAASSSISSCRLDSMFFVVSETTLFRPAPIRMPTPSARKTAASDATW